MLLLLPFVLIFFQKRRWQSSNSDIGLTDVSMYSAIARSAIIVKGQQNVHRVTFIGLCWAWPHTNREFLLEPGAMPQWTSSWSPHIGKSFLMWKPSRKFSFQVAKPLCPSLPHPHLPMTYEFKSQDYLHWRACISLHFGIRCKTNWLGFQFRRVEVQNFAPRYLLIRACDGVHMTRRWHTTVMEIILPKIKVSPRSHVKIRHRGNSRTGCRISTQ